MVEIIKRGTPPRERKHEVTCKQCFSELSFVESEAQRYSDQREGGYLVIECPVCNNRIIKSIR